MKALVIGSGGREHVLCWKIAKSPLIRKLYCAPGNAGICKIAEPVKIDPASLHDCVDFAAREKIDLTVVGPELPLTLGIVDAFTKQGLRIFGTSLEASRLEGSKVFAKEFMARKKIPTASFKVFDTPDDALTNLKAKDTAFPIVVKADGLAAGKGVIICKDHHEAEGAVRSIMIDKAFGRSGDRIVIEECLQGKEVSFLVFTDGEHFIACATSQDYKRALDNDEGLNTGGMGAYSPSAYLSGKDYVALINQILMPTINGMAEEGRTYRGILYIGLMLTEKGPKVLEYNVRFGDPETQVILPRMKSDIIPILNACIDGTLSRKKIEWTTRASVCVIAASEGYPGSYVKGKAIQGLNDVNEDHDLQVFHAGTSMKNGGEIVTSGGRVLGVNALGGNIEEARTRAYDALGKIRFEGMHYRKDIALDALKR